MKKLIENIKLNPYKRLAITSFLLLIFFILKNLFLSSDFSNSYIPEAKTFTTIVYSFCCLLCIPCFINRKFIFFYYIGQELLCLINILNGNELFAFILLVYLLTLLTITAQVSTKLKILIYSAIVIVNSALVIPLGIRNFATFLMLSSVFSILYDTLGNLLHKLYPIEKIEMRKTINLSSYNFSERQLFCIKEIYFNNSTLSQISEQINISESVIKKEISSICKAFDVSDKNELFTFFHKNLLLFSVK